MPPAITLQQAQAINTKVRGIFSSGYKSSNKVYSYPRTEDDAIDFNKLTQREAARSRVLKRYETRGHRVEWSSRNQNAREAARRRNARVPDKDSSYSSRAAALTAIPAAESAGNCEEMAIYAAKIVSDEIPDAAYIARLKPPGDHVFCVVAKPKPRAELANAYALANYRDWVVIDPWLNVCCSASEYPGRCCSQLQNWANSGKRILWKGEFYDPVGSYKDTFTTSGVKIEFYK